MTEQASSDQTPVDSKVALKAKRAGQTCVTLFVIFAISLLTFGKTPFERVIGADGWGINFNFISCLGVAVGVFAFFFMLMNLKKVLRLPTARKALGLIGGLGLIAHTVFALVLPLSWGAGGSAPVSTGGRHPFAQSGPEEWVVDGKTYRITSTYYLRLPQGLQYTIEYPHRFDESGVQMNDERALAVVFPLLQHAYTEDLYKRTSVTKIGEGTLAPSRIGVTLYEKHGGGVRGYGVALSLDRIRERMDKATATAPGPTLPSGEAGN